jgi:hypothetical protein
MDYPKRLIYVIFDRSLTKIKDPLLPIWIPDYFA